MRITSSKHKHRLSLEMEFITDYDRNLLRSQFCWMALHRHEEMYYGFLVANQILDLWPTGWPTIAIYFRFLTHKISKTFESHRSYSQPFIENDQHMSQNLPYSAENAWLETGSSCAWVKVESTRSHGYTVNEKSLLATIYRICIQL